MFAWHTWAVSCLFHLLTCCHSSGSVCAFFHLLTHSFTQKIFIKFLNCEALQSELGGERRFQMYLHGLFLIF